MKNSDGKIVFLPFEGGNADSLVAAAKAAGAVGLALYDPTPAEGEEYDYVNVELTNYDVPVARVNLTEFNWMKQNNSTGTVSIKPTGTAAILRARCPRSRPGARRKASL